jgi:hypothetical protein
MATGATQASLTSVSLVPGTPVTGTAANWSTVYTAGLDTPPQPVSKNAALFTVTNWAGSGEIILKLQGSWDGTAYWNINNATVSGNGVYTVSAMEAGTDQVLTYYTNAYAAVLPSTGTSAAETASCTITATLLSAP